MEELVGGWLASLKIVIAKTLYSYIGSSGSTPRHAEFSKVECLALQSLVYCSKVTQGIAFVHTFASTANFIHKQHIMKD